MGLQVNWPVKKPHYKYGVTIFLPVILLENLAQLFNDIFRKHESSNNLQGMQKLMEQSTMVKLVVQPTAGCVSKGDHFYTVWDI